MCKYRNILLSEFSINLYLPTAMNSNYKSYEGRNTEVLASLLIGPQCFTRGKNRTAD